VSNISNLLEQLAIHGGPRTMGDAQFAWPPADDDVRRAIELAYADGTWGRYHGPHGQRLTQSLAELHQLEFVGLCCSGTFAVELALRALKIGPGDEVVVPAYDFPGNFRSVEATGARPVLVDIQPENWGLDLDQLPTAVGPATRAVLVSHLHGGLVDMGKLTRLAGEHELRVVEDACQAPGAVLEGKMAGAWGDVGVLSFGGSKLLTAGRGGAILTRHANAYQRAKIFCERGNQAFPLTELQAAILAPQVHKLAERNRRRTTAVARLLQKTRGLPGLRPLENRTEGIPSYFKLAWRYEAEQVGGCPIDEFVAAARAEGISIERGFPGFFRRSERRCRKVGDLPHAARAAATTLVLHHPILLEPQETIDRLAAGLQKVAAALGGGKG
jgi:dTDP-4-amino-4,6-dideoxygalactose transaminase